MIAADLVNINFPTIDLQSSLRFASELFAEHCVAHLPIVSNNNKLEGILPAEAVLHLPDKDTTLIDVLKDDFISASVLESIAELDVFETIAKFELTVLPVTDENYNYIGSIRSDELFFKASEIYSFKEPGGIIKISLGAHDYSLSEIARIVESENFKILVLYMDIEPETGLIKLTLKLNTFEIGRIVSAFNRYNYQINYTYPSILQTDDMKDRYDLLMKLLDI